jgi:hypothetical protein
MWDNEDGISFRLAIAYGIQEADRNSLAIGQVADIFLSPINSRWDR